MLSDPQVTANLAANLARILKDRGLNQTDLARMTGDPLMTISRVVRGTNDVRSGVVARIAEALDVSADRLLGPPPEPISEKQG